VNIKHIKISGKKILENKSMNFKTGAQDGFVQTMEILSKY